MSDTLFGDPGKRTEEIQWGVRYRRDTLTRHRGEVEIRPGESSARFSQTDEAASFGWRRGDCEVVRRTVVTYTGDWESA